MALSDSSRMGDIFPWWILPSPGTSATQTVRAPLGDQGSAAPDDLGGVAPWGCDQRDPGPQDQA